MSDFDYFISIGSNIDPEKNFVEVIKILRLRYGILQLSAVYRTPPTGYFEQNDFLNMAVRFQSDKSPTELKEELLGIEGQLKRKRDPNNISGPRTIDLDISLWGNQIADYGTKPWHVPDKDILYYAHVAFPLADLAPDYAYPGDGRTLKEIAALFNADTIEKVTLEFE